LTSIGLFFYDTGMLKHLVTLSHTNLRAILRDRILYAVLAVALLMLLLVPSMSTFSMRQVQELAISISLSASSFVLLIVALLLGSSSIWRDVERRYLASVLTLPVSRTHYLLAKFVSIGLFLVACAAVLGLVAALVVTIAATQYPSDTPVSWTLFVLALAADTVKYIVLASVAILLSSVSTSFFLPFFGTIAIYLTGSASQEVYEYVAGQAGQELSSLALAATKGAYYLLPNFAAFDFKVQAVYALDVSLSAILYPLVYSVIYLGLVLVLAAWIFNRRQLS
jgi:ABC-type transport system involved in multi-copper enzyme maturation permease subunit